MNHLDKRRILICSIHQLTRYQRWIVNHHLAIILPSHPIADALSANWQLACYTTKQLVE